MSLPRYPNYKDSGAEWLGEVPEHWEVKRVRFVAQLNPSKSELSALARDTAVSFVPMDAIGEDGSLSLDKEKPISEVETGYTYFRNGDVTVAKITPCYENGKGALMQGLLNGIGFGTTELIVVRPNSGQVTGTYLHYLFISPDFRGLGESHMYGAGGQKRIPDDFVRNFATAFPPVREQTQIAAFLDRETAKIDELVAEQRRLMALLKEKRQAVISHAVTRGLNPDAPLKPSGIEWLGDVPKHWEVLPAKRVSSVFVPQRNKPELNVDGEGLFWVTMEQMRSEEIKSAELSVTESAARDAGTRVLPAGAVVASCVGTFGLAAINCVDVIINQQLQAFIPTDRVDAKFLRHCVVIAEGYFEQIGTAATIAYVNQLGFANMPLVLPPKTEQHQIVEFLAAESIKFDTLTTEAQRAIDLLQERRTALISAAVTGQIDVRGAVAA
jgi:type I restriction enzyme S subunit